MKKLPKLSSIRNKCDSLLTPIIKQKYPVCILGGELTQVAHHFVHRSKSNRLRYDLINLIPLCNKCHQKLHHNESYWAAVIVEEKGMEWFRNLDLAKRETVKTDIHWYMKNLARLQNLLNTEEEIHYEK